MAAADTEKQDRAVLGLLTDLLVVETAYRRDNRLLVSASYRYSAQRSRSIIEDRLELAGYDFTVRDQDNLLILDINPKRRFRIPRTNLILFFATLFSVYFVPVFLRNLAQALVDMTTAIPYPDPSFGEEITLVIMSTPAAFSGTLADLTAGAGLVFTLAMISILFVHEMGHFIASRRRKIITSWPYFIPAPNIIGTFGAIIKSKSPFWNRRDLIEVGATGPIAGWIVALGWLIYGLTNSTVAPMVAFGPKDIPFLLYGESILMKWLAPLLVGPLSQGSAYMLSEAAFAGWVGLLVTAINMLPIGQLDGGHVVYGLARKPQRLLGILAMGGLVVLGFDSPIWWIFAGFGLVFGVAHPPTMDDNRPPGATAAVLGIVALIILILSFTPVPFDLP